jgi:aspartate aminotransferase
MIVCSSFSKNFGLYNERVGAMTVVTAAPECAAAVASQVKVVVRVNYSNPPAHGGEIVQTVLGDAELRKQWDGEVAVMRNRINGMRKLFVDTLARKGARRNFDFIVHQRGMFSFSGLTKEQVEALKTKHAIYAVGSGRINVAGMTAANMDRLCEAIVDVL